MSVWLLCKLSSIILQQDEELGAIPLAGYRVSLPNAVNQTVFLLGMVINYALNIFQDEEPEKKSSILKLTHSICPVFFFELPSSYDFER